MNASSRSSDKFCVVMLGRRPGKDSTRFAEYLKAEKFAKEQASRYCCAFDIFRGRRLVATACTPNFQGQVKVDMTTYGATIA
ncbi:hypothetical protein [Gluconobacter morbifer]|nr:hypothetical protein [Gluconobacter morbifer]